MEKILTIKVADKKHFFSNGIECIINYCNFLLIDIY